MSVIVIGIGEYAVTTESGESIVDSTAITPVKNR